MTKFSEKLVAALMVTATMLGLHLGVASARDDQNTYRCTTKDAVSIRRDGTLDRLVAEPTLKVFDKIVIDVSNGNVTYPSEGIRDEWIVEKVGGTETDYVLYPKSARHILGNTVANAVSHYIRLRAAKGEHPRFIVFTLSYLVTGTCELAPG